MEICMKKLLITILMSALLAGAAAADETILPIDAGRIYRIDKAEIKDGVITNFADRGVVWWNFGASDGEEVDPIAGSGWYDLTITYARANAGAAVGAVRSVNARGPYNIHMDLAFPPTSDEPDDWSVFKTVTFKDIFMDARGNLLLEPFDCGTSERFIDIREVSLATSDGEPTERARKRMLPQLAGEWLAAGALIEREGLPARIVIDEAGGFESFAADGKVMNKGTLSLSREYEGQDIITYGLMADGKRIEAFNFDRSGMIHFGSDFGLEYQSGFVTDAEKTADAFAKINGTWVADGDAFLGEDFPQKFVFDGEGGFRAFDANGSEVISRLMSADGQMTERGVLKLHKGGDRPTYQLWNPSWGSPGQSMDFALNDDGTIEFVYDGLIYKRQK